MADASKMLEVVTALEKTHKELGELMQTLSRGPASYYFGCLREHIEALYSFAMFQEGSEVELAHNIDCSNAPGWQGSEHFLKRGAKATVAEIAFGKQNFSYAVVFDNETWKDKDGTVHPIETNKHQYWFKECDLRPVRKAALAS